MRRLGRRHWLSGRRSALTHVPLRTSSEQLALWTLAISRDGTFFCCRSSQKHFTGVETQSASWKRNRETIAASQQCFEISRVGTAIESGVLYKLLRLRCDRVQVWGRDSRTEGGANTLPAAPRSQGDWLLSFIHDPEGAKSLSSRSVASCGVPTQRQLTLPALAYYTLTGRDTRTHASQPCILE